VVGLGDSGYALGFHDGRMHGRLWPVMYTRSNRDLGITTYPRVKLVSYRPA
jgi:hypothetical protein